MAIHMSGDSIEFLEGDIQIDDDGVFTFQTSVEHFSVVDDIALALIRWQQRIHKMAPEERLGSRYAIYGQGEVFHLTSPEGVPLCEKVPGSRPGSYRLLKTTGDTNPPPGSSSSEGPSGAPPPTWLSSVFCMTSIRAFSSGCRRVVRPSCLRDGV